jgi:protein TonB
MLSTADAKPESAEAHAPAKAAKSEAVLPLSRRERRAMRKEVAKPQVSAAKVPAEAKASPVDKKSPEAAKAAPDAKPTAVAKAPVTAAPAAAPAAGAAPADVKPPAEVRTAMFANLTTSPAPAKFYPPEALRRKERGSVNLKVCADGEGAVSESMEVLKSSGSKLLDEAAMSWAREVTWVPATYNRRRVEGCAKVDVAFEPPPDLASARH